MYQKRHLTELSTWIVFYLFATSITWLGEFTVLGLFNSYAYKPGVFNDPWAKLSSHLILNSTLWPGMAILVLAYSLGYKWICLFSAGNVLIEYLFVKFGMYEQHWWKYYMTAGAVVLFLTITKKWFCNNESRATWINTLYLPYILRIRHHPHSLSSLVTFRETILFHGSDSEPISVQHHIYTVLSPS